MALSRLPMAAGMGLALWGAWWALVLRRVARSHKVWGPRWLARLLSGGLYKFICFWINLDDDGLAETQKRGLWDDGKQYFLIWHPHGQFGIAALYCLAYRWASNYPSGREQFVVIAPLLLNIPGLAEFILLCNGRAVERGVMGRILDSRAAILAMQPGGIPEQVSTDNEQERIFFPKKLGFIRLALQKGVPLLPSYAFGENQLYKTRPWLIKLNTWIYRATGVGTLLVFGQLGLLNSPIFANPGMFPVRGTPMSLKVGKPIDLGPAVEDPSEERVQEAFQKYLGGIAELFHTHKDACLPPNVAAKGLTAVVRASGIKGKWTEIKL